MNQNSSGSDKSKVSARAGIQISIQFTEYCLVIHQGLSRATAFVSLICCTLTESVGIVYTWTRSALLISCSVLLPDGSESLFAVVIACYSEIHGTSPHNPHYCR